MHRFRSAVVLAPILALACSSPAARRTSDGAQDSAATRQDAAITITAPEMREHITFLANDALRGRDTPSPGLDTAATYIARAFDRLGLEPAGDDGTFVQRYPLPLVALDTMRTRLGLRGPDGAVSLAYGRDYFALAGEPDLVEAPLVFVGARADAAGDAAAGGRIPVVALDGSVAREWRSTIGTARAAASRAGAPAIVFVLEPATTTGTVAALARLAAEPQRIVGRVEATPTFFVSRDAVREPFAAAGLDLGSAAAPAEPSALHLAGRAPVRVLDSPSAPNVVAVLPGRDPTLRDSYVAFSAHIDHVGVGGTDVNGDSIYNGADDNASGTAALLEVAEAFASLPVRPARSLLFVAVSGEEKGLLGSRWFTDHPTIPLERVVADINVDMIARNAPDSVVVIGQEYSSLGPLVRDVAARHPDLGLTVAEDIWPEQRFFFRSDHFNFARKEIPALFFFAGTHEDYHRPSDEAMKIDADKAARVARLIFLTGHAVASSAESPRWTDDGLAEVRALTR